MQPLESLASLCLNRHVALTIGVFDGVHLGHQHLLGGVVQRARAMGGLGIVVTFHPHPQLVLRPSLQPAYLTTLEERLALMAGTGIDLTVTLRFTVETAQVTAREFVTALCRAFRLVELRVGPDFALGHKRQGTIPVLRDLGRELGFSVAVAEPWEAEGVVVSSTRIRERLKEGDVAHAARLLGRLHAVSGTVVTGDRRGRTLGFATANLETAPELLLPADGVYAVYAEVDGRSYPAVSNIGRRPSFDNAPRTFEVHLLDFEGDLYGRQVAVRFAQRLRGEVRFPDLSALAAQIRADAAQARAVLAPASLPAPHGSAI